MKNLCFIFLGILFSSLLMAQSPNAFKYQAVLRDASGNIIANQNKTVKIDLLQCNTSGTIVFTETHSVTTSDQGLINIDIGSVDTTDLAAIDWSKGPYFIRITINGIEFGTSQLLSVPYAKYAEKAGNSFSGNYNDLSHKPTLFDSSWISIKNKPDFTMWDKDSTDNVMLTGNQIIGGKKTFFDTVNMNYKPVINVAEPIDSLDAANKKYVDALYHKVLGLLFTHISKGLTAKDLVSAGVPLHDIIIYHIPGLLAAGISDTVVYNNFQALFISTVRYFEEGIGGFYLQKYGSYPELVSLGLIGTVNDIDGNTYDWIRIGSQIWMSENLKVTRYQNGDSVPLVTGNTNWGSLTTGGRCYYNNDQATYVNTYGALYNWYAVTDNRKLCPAGWRIPADNDYLILSTFLSPDSAGNRMKERGTTHFNNPNTGADNSSGFTGIPGGFRYNNGGYYDLGTSGSFWVSNDMGSNVKGFQLINFFTHLHSFMDVKSVGTSVRCIKN